MAICLAAPVAVRAQNSPANPVVASAQEIVERLSKYIAGAADEMPADKYNYHPTPEQWTFGKIVSHIAQSDFNLCAILSDMPAPQNWKVTDVDPKEKLVPAVKASFDFCSQALANLQDSKLGDTVNFFGGRKVPRARALIELTDDLEDHYSQLASYLRMNGMVPPSVKPTK
jgi:uncharacterized damage-inducible protein DinB